MKEEDLLDLQKNGIMVNMYFDNQEELLKFLKEQKEELSTKKFILLSSGYHG